MTSRKQLWVLTGGNGSGKSTFYTLFLRPHGIKLLNADQIAKEIDPDNPEEVSYKAAIIAEHLRDNFLHQGISFCFETVFSHVSKIDFIAKAKSLGYQVILIYFHLIDSSLNEARVWQRVTEGGHSVPPDKIRSRIPRTMKHISKAIPLADEVRLIDNSSRDTPYVQISLIKNSKRSDFMSPLPDWAEMLVNPDIPKQ